MTRARLSVLLVLPVAFAACVVNVRSRTQNELVPQQTQVTTPLRVFLTDGSVVFFSEGASIDEMRVNGTAPGQRYDLTRSVVDQRRYVPLDSVMGIEAFGSTGNGAASFVATVGATALGVAAAAGLSVAIFGSCPTVYFRDAEGERLEAETFSYSISPLLEARDVDRLAASADPAGRVELEIRNEALETHFINHLELMEARHAPTERVVPDTRNEPVVVGPLNPVGPVVARDGLDVSASIAAPDGEAFRSTEAQIQAATPEDHRDWLELTLPPAPTDSAAVVLRLRNSLLNTTLFYDFMLARQGAGALDWMAQEVEQIGNAVALGSWFHRVMGLRLETEQEGSWVEVGRIGDAGPIAWREVAFVVPVEPGEPTRLRFSFLADGWRIDHLSWSPQLRRPDVRLHAPADVRIIPGTGTPPLEAGALELLSEPDESYFVTTAGSAFVIGFETGPLAEEAGRTFLLSSQGYYTEWVRPEWIRTADQPEPFVPGDEILAELMGRWLEVKDDFEARFHDSRFPVR